MEAIQEGDFKKAEEIESALTMAHTFSPKKRTKCKRWSYWFCRR